MVTVFVYFIGNKGKCFIIKDIVNVYGPICIWIKLKYFTYLYLYVLFFSGGVSEQRSHTEPLQPGLLVAEPYSWKSLVTGQPILRLRSTATRAAVLSLPEG